MLDRDLAQYATDRLLELLDKEGPIGGSLGAARANR
jgi:hypothetical protein